MRKAALYYTKAFLQHDTGDHAEQPARLAACIDYLRSRGALDALPIVAPPPATLEDLQRVHARDYIETIRSFAEAGGSLIDPDTPVSSGSFDAAVLAAGAAIEAATSVFDGRLEGAFALVRPPGHHAQRRQGAGFCLFNNIAVAAKRLLAVGGAKRLAILDFDIHHGNGTEEAVKDEPRAVFVSFHRYPFYPGSGGPKDAALAGGRIVNVPLRYDTTAGQYLERWKEVLASAVRPFAPEIILVSAGFDTYRFDPIGGLNLDVSHFRDLGKSILALADDVCGGKVASVLEGGYDLDGLPRCLEAYLEGLEILRKGA